MGIRWRRRFAEVPKAEIREFLTLFVDAFGYDHQRRTCFSPDDRVMDIYHAENPPGSIVDQMELESFALSIDERYGLDLEAIWKDDLTLGELFAHTRKRGA